MPLQFRKQRMFQRGGVIFRKSVTDLATLKDKVHPAEKSVSSESTRQQHRECSDDKTHRCDEPDSCYPSSDRKEIFASQRNTMGKSGRVIEVSDLSQKKKCIDNSKKHGQNVESSIFVNINVVEGEGEALKQQKIDDRSPWSHATVVHAKTGELGTRVLTQTHQPNIKPPKFQRRRHPRLSVEPCSAVRTQTHQPNIKPPRFQRRPSGLSGNVSHLDENREREKSFPIKGSSWRHQFANSEQKSCHGTSYFHCRSDATKMNRQQSNSYGSSSMAISAEVDMKHCTKIASNYRPLCNTELEDWSLDLIDLSQGNVFNKASMEGHQCMTVQELQPLPSPDSGIGKSLLDSSTYHATFVENWDHESVPVTVTTQDSVPVVMNTHEGIPVMRTGENTTITVNTSPEQKEDTDSNLGGHALMTCIEEVESSDLQSTPKIAVYANKMGSANTENTALNDNTFSAINPESNFAPTLFQKVSCMKQKIEDRFQEPEDWTDELIVVGLPPQLVNDIGVCLHDNISQNSDSLKESFHFPSTEIHPRLHVKVYKRSSVSLVTDVAVEIKMVNAFEKLGAGIASKESTLDESNHSLTFEPEHAHEMELLMDEPESRHLNKPERSVISGSKDYIHEQKILASKSLDSECVHGSLFLKNTLSEKSLMHKSEVSENPALESKLLNEAEHHPKPLINALLGQNHVHELNHLQKTSVASHMHEPKFLVKSISDRDAVQDPELLLNKSNEPELVGKSKLLRTTAKSCPGHEPSLSLLDSFVDGNEVEYTKSEKLELYSACASQPICGATSSETYSTGNTAVGQLLPENTPKILEITSQVNQNQLESEYSIHYNSNLASAVECSKQNCHISTTLTNSQNGANLEKLKLTVCDVDVESPKTYTSSKGEIKDFDVDNILPESRLVPSLFQSHHRAHKSIICSNDVSEPNNIKYLYFAPKRSSDCHSQQSSGSQEDQRNKIVKEFSTQKELVYYHPDLDRQGFKNQLRHEKINIKNRQNLSKTLQEQKELPRDRHVCLSEKSSDYFAASSEEYGHEEEDRMRHFHRAGHDVRIIPGKDDSRNTSKEVIVGRGRGFYKEYLTKEFHHVDRHTNLGSVHVIKAAGCENVSSVSTQKKEDPSVTECKFLTAEDSDSSQEGTGREEVSVHGIQFKEGHDLYDFSERVWGSSNDSSVHAPEAAYFRLGPSKNNYAHNDNDIATNHDELCSLPYDEDSCSSEDEGPLSMKNMRIFRTTSQEDLTSTSVFHSFAYERGSKDRGQGNMKSHYIPPISSGKSYQKDTASYSFHGCDPAAQGHLDFYQRYCWSCHFPDSLSEWEHWQREQHKAYQQWYSLRRCTQKMGPHPHRFENGTGVEDLSSSLKQMSFESELHCEKSLTEEEEFKTFKGHHSQNLYKEGSAKCICAEDEMWHAQIIPQVGDRHAKTCGISKVDHELEARISMNNSQGTGKEQAEKARKSTQQIRKTHLDMTSSESENLLGKTTRKTEMHFRDESGIEEGDEIEPERYVRATPSEALGLCTYCREWMQYWNNCRFPAGIQPSFCSISNTPTTVPHTPQCWNKITSSRTRSDQGPSPFGRERSGQEQWPHYFNWDTGSQSCLYHGYKPAARSPEERTISYPYSCGDAWACTEQMDPTEHSSRSRISSGPWHNQGMSSQTSSNMGVGHPLMSSNSFEGQWNYMEETSQIPNISTTISQDERNKDNDKNSSVLNLQRETKDGSSEHHCTISALSLGQIPDSKTFNIPHRVRDEFIDAELENQAKIIDNKQIKSLNAIDSSLNGMISAQVVSPHWLTEQYTSPSFGSRIDNVYRASESSINSEKADMKSNYRPIKGRYSYMAGDVPSQDPVRNREDLPISKGVMNGQGQSSVVEKTASPFPYNYIHVGMPSRNMPFYRQDEYEGFTVANTKDIETKNSNSGCFKDSRDKARVAEDSSFEDQSLYTTWSFPPPHFPYKAALSVRGLPSSNNPGYCYQQRTASSMNGQEIRLSSVNRCSNLPGFYPSDMQVSKPRSLLELSGASNFGDGTIFPHAFGDTNEQNAESTGWSAHLQTDSRSVSETKVTSVPALGKQHSQSIWDYSTVSQDNYQPEAEPVEHAAIKLKSSHSTVLQTNSKVGNFGKELEEEETIKTGETPVPRYIPPHKRHCSVQSSSSDSSPVSTAGKSHRFPQHRKSSYSLLARKTDHFLAESSSISSRGDTDSDDSTVLDVSVASQESLTMPYYDPTRPPPVLPPFPASPFWSMYTSSEPSGLLRHDQMKSFSSRPEPGKTDSSDLELVNVSHGGAIRKEDFRNSRFNTRSLMTAEIVSDSSSIQCDWKTHYNTRVEGYGQTYIDSHCHLDFLFNRSGFKGTVAKFKELNKHAFPKTYEGCVAVFCNPASFTPTGGLWMDVAAEKDVWLAFGCHPKMATDFTPWAEQSLQECMQHPKAVALGEIGLDYSGTFRQHEALQKDVFRRQLKIALEMSKPLVIHCRDAEEDCLSILREMVPSDYKIHCHCFTGFYENAKLWMEAFPNLYIGLTPLVTYHNAAPSHNLARFLPLSKLLLETDAPYFIPRQVPKIEVMFSHPGFAVTVAEEVARIKEIPVDIVLNAARINTRDMYGI